MSKHINSESQYNGVVPVDQDGMPLGTQETPMTTADAKGGTRYYDWAQNKRTAAGSTSSAADIIPPLYASRELMAHASVRCFVRFGGSGVLAASAGANQLILEAGERFHFRVNAGDTHFRVIRDTADGHLTLTSVIA